MLRGKNGRSRGDCEGAISEEKYLENWGGTSSTFFKGLSAEKMAGLKRRERSSKNYGPP